MSRNTGRRRRKRSLGLVTRVVTTAFATTVAVTALVWVIGSDTPTRVNPDRTTAGADSSGGLPAATTAPPSALVASPEPKVEEISVPSRGKGTFDVAEGQSTQGTGGQRIAYQVEVETGLPFRAYDFAKRVDTTLKDRRGWSKSGKYTFDRRGSALRRIVLASPKTVDELCAPLQTRGRVSCRNGDVVAINALRWAEGAKSYSRDLSGYRTYVINHEVGHSLGLAHQPCPAAGRAAPVMLQQTLGLDGCEKNPWP